MRSQGLLAVRDVRTESNLPRSRSDTRLPMPSGQHERSGSKTPNEFARGSESHPHSAVGVTPVTTALPSWANTPGQFARYRVQSTIPNASPIRDADEHLRRTRRNPTRRTIVARIKSSRLLLVSCHESNAKQRRARKTEADRWLESLAVH